MTSFNALETSIASSRPIELYEFILGANTYRYASCEDDITIGSNTYTATAIARSKIEQGSDQGNRTLTVTVPTSNAFAEQYLVTTPGNRGEINVYRYQRDESPSFTTQVLLFKGLVQSVRFPEDGTVAEIAVRSIEAALNRNVPRFSYMGMCNHFLYDAGCGVNPALFNHIGAVSAVSGNTVTITGLNASGRDYVGGYCSPVGESDPRLVLAQSGDTITILLPFAVEVLGGNLQVFAGCNHIHDEDCATVFDNVLNFGGFPFVPKKNVFEVGVM